MNHLRPGLLDEIRGSCVIHETLQKWERVPDSQASLCFVLRGSISLVQMLPHADQQDMLEPQVRGFSFREGKRLRRRYPPGHVVGKVSFFLATYDQGLDDETRMRLVVSSKLGDSAEV